MNVLAESIIAAFDSNTEIVWSLETSSKAIARFSLTGAQVVVTFRATDEKAWRVGFDVDSKLQLGDGLGPAIRVFSGVFQTVKEFLEIRQPERLVFASKDEGLGHIYETYLKRQDTELHKLGYQTEATKMSPLAEFSIVKTTPTDWKN